MVRRIGMAGVVCALLLLAVYGATMAPSLTWAHDGADGGDLAAAVVRGGIPHPPGAPTYLLLGGLFVRLPWGDPAWRLNLASAVAAACAGGLTAAVGMLVGNLAPGGEPPADGRTARRRGGGKGEPALARGASMANPREVGRVPAALATGLMLGLAPLLWSQALITEVYALATLFSALVVVLALRGGAAWPVGLAWGVGLGVHPALVFLAPVVAWSGWSRRWRGLLEAGLAALLAWGVLYGPVLLARGGVPSPWGDVRSFAGWWELVSGRLYHGYLLGLPAVAWPDRLLAWVWLAARQFTPLGLVVSGLGAAHLVQGDRSTALVRATALSLGGFSLHAIGYDTADSLVILAPALPLAALWLGAGLAHLGSRLRAPQWARLFLLLPLLQALFSWGEMDLGGDREALEWARRVLEQAPAQALLLTGEDGHTFALWYVHDGLGERPDVVMVDRDLWAHPPYRRLVLSELGLGELGFEEGEGFGIGSPEEAARRAGRPLVVVDEEP